MSLLVSGFNGFGQFDTNKKRKRKLSHFEGLSLKDLINNDDNYLEDDNNNNVIISCAWSYLCIAKGNVLYLKGFISNQKNYTRSITTNNPIKAIATNDRFCLVLLENGRLFKLLPKLDAQLQEIILIPDHSLQPQKRTIFGEMKPSTSMKIAFVDCGSNITVLISSTNIVFGGTTQIYQFPQHIHIAMLRCGFEHAAVLTKNGDIYTWGNGLRGQLGQEILRTEECPTLVEALAGLKIISIAASGWHMAAISSFGDLYTWGFNSNGQLGLNIYRTQSCQSIKEPAVYALPQIIDLPLCECMKNNKNNGNIDDRTIKNCLPIKVEAGARHTLVLNECGNLYGSGWNSHGQLGLASNEELCDNFQIILTKEITKRCTQIYCGDWCTILKI